MSKSYPMVPLGNIIKQRSDFIEIDDFKTYKRCRVQLHAQGIVQRDVVQGIEIKTKKQQVCRAGEFLVAEIDAKVGGFGIVPDNLDGAIVSSHYYLFELDETVLNRRLLEFFARTPAFMEQVRAQGTTNYAAIRPGDILGYKVPIPPLEEQRRIVARIEELAAKIEEARGLRREAVEEANVLTRIHAQRLLATTGAQLTELRHWLELSRDGIQTGPFGAQLGSHDFENSGIPVLSIGNIQYSGLELDNLRYVSEEKAQRLFRFSIKEGDILFARMGTVGRCCVAPKEAEGWLFNYHIIRVALDKSQVNPRYIHWSIRTSRDIEQYLDEKIRGATREGVNSSIVGSLPVRIPSLCEQQHIVAQLDDLQVKVDNLKRVQSETSAELDALLPSILDKAFKGELS
jgi:type I restriction enzyme, S subunit